MPRCTVCNHPRSHDIDLAILSGNHTLSELKQLFGPSRSAFHRHQKHLQQKISRAEARLENNIRQAYLFKLNALLEEASDTIKTSREEGNSRLRLQAINSSARLVQAMDKMAVRLDRQTVYRLLASPQGVQSDCLLPTSHDIPADNFRGLALGLKFPCPEAAPCELEDPENREDEPAGSEVAATDLAAADGKDNLAAAPESLSQFSPPQNRDLADFLAEAAALLPDSPDAPPAPPAAETQVRRQRDRSGTEAGQTAPLAKESLQNHSVKQDDEKSETTPAPPRKTAARHRKSPSRNPKLETPPQESLFDRFRRKLAQNPAPAPQDSCNSDQLYQQYLREKAAALAYLNSPPASAEAQPPPPEPQLSPEENPAPPDAAGHRPAAASDPSPETGNQKPETGASAPAPQDRYAGYFKFPGDYPPGYLYAVTHGYWPDDPPEHIPDRRWEEDFGSAGRFGKTKGTY